MEINEEKEVLIDELKQKGIKHNPNAIVRIAKTNDGQIIFLETGDAKSGLQHILRVHRYQFEDNGISETEIPDIVIMAALNGKIIGYQGKNMTRPIYELTFKGQTYLIAITIGNNGYIVGANPNPHP